MKRLKLVHSILLSVTLILLSVSGTFAQNTKKSAEVVTTTDVKILFAKIDKLDSLVIIGESIRKDLEYQNSLYEKVIIEKNKQLELKEENFGLANSKYEISLGDNEQLRKENKKLHRQVVLFKSFTFGIPLLGAGALAYFTFR